MADTTILTGNALTVKLFSQLLMVEAKKRATLTKFIGPDQGSMIQILEDSQKHPGDSVTVGLRMQLTGAGVLGDGVVDGAEEALTLYSDALLINQIRAGVKIVGQMTQQRVSYNLLEQAKSGLADWFSSRFDLWGFVQLSGNTNVADTRYSGLQAVIAPTTARQFFQNAAASEAALVATDTMTLTFINTLVVAAKTLSPAIRPVKTKAGEYYVLFLHPYQVKDLRNTTSANEWNAIQQAAMMGGEVSNNPIFTGATGMYNGVIIHEDTRVPWGTNAQNVLGSTTGGNPLGTSNVARAIFCGAQAGAMGFGRGYDWPHRYKWVTDTKDYENQVGVVAGVVAGLKKLVFNSVDFGVLTASSYAAST